jgi:hypothetical protein
LDEKPNPTSDSGATMKQITITFSKATAWDAVFSWLIMLAEGTPYSHVAIKMQDLETGVNIVYQASHTFVNAFSEAEFLAAEDVIYSFTFIVDDVIEKDGRKFAENALGVPYGVLGCFGLGIVQIAAWVGIKMNNPFKEVGQTYWCSAFIAAILENADVLITEENLNNMTPKDLYPLIASLPPVWNEKSKQ